jgi:hypothetical protein
MLGKIPLERCFLHIVTQYLEMKIDFLGISQRGCCVVRVEYTNIQFYAATLSQVFPRKFIDNRAYNLATASVRL